MNENEERCLEVLANQHHSFENCLYFRHIADVTDLEIKAVRRAVRSLARKGFAEYTRGLFSDDGLVAGRGYCCTKSGFEAIQSSSPYRAKEGKVYFNEDNEKVAVWFVVSKWRDKVSWTITAQEPTNLVAAVSHAFGPYLLSVKELPQEVTDEIKRRKNGPPVLPADVGVLETEEAE